MSEDSNTLQINEQVLNLNREEPQTAETCMKKEEKTIKLKGFSFSFSNISGRRLKVPFFS